MEAIIADKEAFGDVIHVSSAFTFLGNTCKSFSCPHYLGFESAVPLYYVMNMPLMMQVTSHSSRVTSASEPLLTPLDALGT